jgi:tetratricopeptide (TPR) repeat protein
MSYINEALKKAQELKDSGYAKYYNIAASGNNRSRRFRIRIFVYSVSAALLIFLLLLGYRWLGSSHEKSEATSAIENKAPAEEKNARLDKKELYDKALSLHKAGRTREAKKLYEAVVALDPGYIEALNNLGIIYIHDRDFNSAQETLNKAVRLNPSYVESYYNLACLYAIKGDTDHCLDYLKKAITLDASVKEWARNDSDLQGLKASDEFNRILSQ